MLIFNSWEMFRTISNHDEQAEDVISIDSKNKRYILDIGVVGYVTGDYSYGDAYEDEGDLTYVVHVSRYIFDMIVNGVKEKNFTELVAKK